MENKLKEYEQYNYDTYIEELFFKKVKSDIKNSVTQNNIMAAWQLDKKIYIDYLNNIDHEFLHYSLHDQSHSVSILQYVYLLLGEKLLDEFSVSDLWIMLEVAYSHDIGMSATYKDLVSIWKDKDEINRIIKKQMDYSDKETMQLYEAIKDKIENDIPDPKSNETINKNACWELELRKAINYINSEYLRKNHPTKSLGIITNMAILECKNHLNIEERFYKIIGQINYLHGEDFSKIFEILEIEELGIETDIFHPRMIAMLLRMGDVLDIRNNRFSITNIEYLGGLPKDSKEHYLKHKGVTKFLVTNEDIRVHINSDDFNVCKNAVSWLGLIKSEFDNFTKYWNNCVSDNLKGLKLKRADLKIYHKGREFIANDISNYLRTDPQKLMKLMVGKNLYDTELIMFREYIQNAIDASKVNLAFKYINDDRFLENSNVSDFRNIVPTDFNKNDYESLSIEINYSYNKDTNRITFEIVDHGIGMDAHGLDALCNVGQGWNKRRTISNKFKQFPEWLTPTGGFGIGVLSAFLLSDKVQFKTKSKRNPCYQITINSPIVGDGTIEKIIDDDGEDTIGTTVTVEVDFNKYYYEISKYFNNHNLELNPSDRFINLKNTGSKEQFLQYTIVKMLKYMLIDVFFPIKINNKTKDYHDNIFVDIYDKLNFWDKDNEIMIKFKPYKDSKIDERQRIDIAESEQYIERLIESKKQIINEIFSYKGIMVENYSFDDLNNSSLALLLDEVVDSIDFNSDKTSDVLDISRSSFSKQFDLSRKVEDTLFNALSHFILSNDQIDNSKNENWNSIMEVLCFYFYEKLEKESSLLKRLKEQKYLFKKKFYYFNRRELQEYLLSKNVKKLIDQYNIYLGKDAINYIGRDDSKKTNPLSDAEIKNIKSKIIELASNLNLNLNEIKENLAIDIIEKKDIRTNYSYKRLNQFLKEYVKDCESYKVSLLELMQEESLAIDFLQDYVLEKQSPKTANSRKTLYYRYNGDKDIIDYKFYTKIYAAKTHSISDSNSIKDFLIRKINKNLIITNLEDVFVEKIRKGDIQLEVNVDNVNTIEYSSIVIDDINNGEKSKIVINPFIDVLGIFTGVYSSAKLFESQVKEQKVLNYLSNNKEYNEFIKNIYNYKLLSMQNTREKDSINKDRIRKEYTLLILNILKKFNK